MTETSNKRSRQTMSINEEELIHQVKLRPELYNRTLKAYKKTGIRHTIWKEVGKILGASDEECRRRWRSLRDTFSKHFKQNNRNDGNAPKRKKWVFYDQMSFMAAYLDNTWYVDKLFLYYIMNIEYFFVIAMKLMKICWRNLQIFQMTT